MVARTTSSEEVEMATAAQETEQIARTVDLYVEGCRDGDAAKLRQAFHPEARLWGNLAGQRYDEPITELIAMLDGSPVDVDGSFQARITALDQTGDAAAVTLAEEGFWGAVSFVDYFSLARIDGEWKIVNKTFVHTGGEPPPME
jgi:hypothetical protein